MAKENVSTEDIIKNIMTTNPELATTPQKKEEEPVSTTRKKIDNPQSTTVVLDGDTYGKLQRYVLERKLAGERGFSVSKLGRMLLEEYVKVNNLQ